MLKRHLTGPGAGALKYDILTALGSFALSADKHTQRRILRLMTLITARYNWAQNEVTVGRMEMARLWGVTERQVKRELGALKEIGFLELKRAGARGRVSSYTLGMEAIFEHTEAAWRNVGTDFAARMQAHGGDPGWGAPEGQRSVIPFPGETRQPGPTGAGETEASGAEPTPLSEWSRIRRALESENQAVFAAWFARLQRNGFADGHLVLRAPTQFHADYVATRLSDALYRAATRVAPEVRAIEVVAGGWR
ncbi:MAG: DnaA N-terminal domain-containing protein [Pseudomonadota bacterium]